MQLRTFSFSRIALNRRHLILGVLTVAIAAVLPFQIMQLSVYDINWHDVYYPASWAFFRGGNPYDVFGFFYPPWSLALIAPLSLLPSEIGRVMLALISFLSFAYVAIRFKATPVALIAFLASPPAASMFRDTNFDGVMMLGLLMPRPLGLFFVLLKPQFGIPVALFWLYETWHEGGFNAVTKTFLPLALVLALSLPIFGLWFTHASSAIPLIVNMSLFPFALPLGLFLLYRAVRTHNLSWALPAGLFLSPYVAMPTWSSALLALIRREKLVVALSLLLWGFIALRILFQF